MRKLLWSFLIIISVVGITAANRSWLMPGPVSRYHAAIEKRCDKCHPGFRGAPNESCLKCKVKMKLVIDRGIHRHAAEKRCATCHIEHRSREYPLASAWVRKKDFKHQQTGYTLGRFHKKLACSKCHPPGLPYRSVRNRARCVQCHKDFSPGVWEHRKTKCTPDALHANLKCKACHINGWGAGKSPVCTGCHPKNKYQPKQLCRENRRR